jgi:hypothetical protein
MKSTAVLIRCSVPACERRVRPATLETALGPLPDTEVICRMHWQDIPAQKRRLYRRARKAFAQAPEANAARINRLWRWLKREAIERAVGLK